MAFRILALSGGGFLGLFSVRLLARMEDALGRPIARSFDLICGTSAGAITSLALSLEIPAREVERTFIEHGPHIFPQMTGRLQELKRTFAFLRSLTRPKYSDTALRVAAESLIKDGQTLAAAKHRLVLPVVNMTTGQIEVFKTPHLAEWTHHAGLPMVDVAVAAAAAPTYFPLAEVRNSLYVDGAIFASAPDLIGVHEAQHYMKQPVETIEVISVGTTTGSFSLPYSAGRDYGAGRWLRGARLFSTIMSAQQQLTNVFLRHHLGDRYVRLDSLRASGLEADLTFDGATANGIKTIFGLADHAFEEAMKLRRVQDVLRGTAPEPVFHSGADGMVGSAARGTPSFIDEFTRRDPGARTAPERWPEGPSGHA